MAAYLSETEKAERAARLEAARAEWVGQELDYGGWTRTVFEVGIDDRDRPVLHARARGEYPSYVPELASEWEG